VHPNIRASKEGRKMKIGIWKRIVLVCKLLLGMQVTQDLRLLLAPEITPLKETIADQASELEGQRLRLETEAQHLRKVEEDLSDSCAREEKRQEELEDLTASIDAKIATVERHAAQNQASALAEQERELLSHFEQMEAGFAQREERYRADRDQAVKEKVQDLSRIHRTQMTEQAVKAETVLQSVLFDLRGGGGEDDRYTHERAYEFCKNLSPKSCKSLRHIVKIESRLSEAENTVRSHLRTPPDPEAAISPVKTRLPVVE